MNAIIETLNSWGAVFTGLAWPMLVQSTVVVALLLTLIWVCQRVRAVFRYALLILILVKLILPPSLSLPSGPAYWLRINSPKLHRDYAAAVLAIDAKASQTSATTVKLSGAALSFLIWAAGLGVLSALVLGRYRRVRRIEGLAAPAEFQRVLDSCREQLGLRRSPHLEFSTACASPAVCGLFRPVILVPKLLADKLTPSQLRHVLLHELAHIKRCDLLVNHLQVFLQLLHWYNPLLWLANAMIRRVREEAVDETVMVTLGQEAQSYPATLVTVAKLAFSRPSFSVGFIGIAESKMTLKHWLSRLIQNPVPQTVHIGWGQRGVILAIAGLLLPMAHPEESGPAKASSEVNSDVKHGSASEAMPFLRSEFTQALQAQGMTLEQFRQKFVGDRVLNPLEFDFIVSQWLLAQQSTASGQASNVVAEIVIQRNGPAFVTDKEIRNKIGAKVGAPITPTDVDSDVRNLYATGLFYNVRVAQERKSEGTILTYIVQEKPRVTQITFEGNTKLADGALREKLVSGIGEPMDERKFFADAQKIRETYQRLGYSEAVVKYKIDHDEKTGRSAVIFQITLNGKSAVVPAPDPLPNGRQIVTTNDNGRIKVWDLASRKEVQTPISSATISPDGHLLVGSADEVVKLWKMPSGREFVVTQAHDKGISYVVFSPDGKRILTFATNQAVRLWESNGTFRVWDATSGKELLAPREPGLAPDPQR